MPFKFKPVLKVVILGRSVQCKEITLNAQTMVIADADKALRIYPNPMTTNSNIEFEVTKASRVTVELYDVTGKKVTSIHNDLKAGLHTYNVSGLNQGVYSVSIKSNDFNYSEKIISNNSTNRTAAIHYTNSRVGFDHTDLKSSNELIPMQYDDGDLLHFRGVSGDYTTVTHLIPTSNTTVTFNFVDSESDSCFQLKLPIRIVNKNTTWI